MAYFCRDFVVNRRKALLANHFALCYDRSWVLIGCMDQNGLIHGVGDLARFTHFNTSF